MQAEVQPYRKLKIGELLIQEGLLTQAQVARLLTMQEVRQHIPLGELLVRTGLVTQEQIQEALEQQKHTKKKLGELLIQAGLITETVLESALDLQTQLTNQLVNRLTVDRPGKFDALVAAQRISQQELAAAIAEAQARQGAVEVVLMDKYRVSKQEIGYALSVFYKCPFVEDSESIEIDPELARRINPSYLKANYWLPLRMTEDRVEVLMDDPYSFDKLQDIKRLFPGKKIQCSVGLQEEILKCVNTVSSDLAREGTVHSLSAILGQLKAEEPEEQDEESADLIIDENDSAIVRLVNQIITDAYKRGASDVHIEPYGKTHEMEVRLRVDGECYDYLKVPSAYRQALVSRLKVMARLDIAERRKPQDGKIRFRLPEREIELRVATIPTAGINNEDVVLRILSASKPKPLDQLHMAERSFQEFARLLEKPHGLILCVGPTGSGKTTTLHAALRRINTPNRKIWTAEDPVEITQQRLRQVQVHPKIGFDFASALRAFLRADPDVIMVGEIRDRETAEVSLQASLTGHLVMSTLHTNSAVETIVRLLDMGMDPFNFADALLGVLAQRLASALCPHCKERYHPSKEDYDALAYGYGEEAFARLGIPYDKSFYLYRSRGCESCYRLGYKGRIGLHELLVVTEEIKSLIHTRATMAELLRVAMMQGMKTLVQDGILKVLQGWTDYHHVRAVAMR